MATKDNNKEAQEQSSTETNAVKNPFKSKSSDPVNENDQDLSDEAEQEQQFKEAQTERD